MMTPKQIRETIVDRLEKIDGSSNYVHIDHNDGVFRGLIWALTGEDPGTYLTKDVQELLRLAGIPSHREGDRVVLDTKAA